MNPFKKILDLIRKFKNQRKIKKRMKELRKRDPFIY